MLYTGVVNGTDVLVYTVPDGKSGLVVVTVNARGTSDVVVKINDLVYVTKEQVSFVTFRFYLTGGDTIKISCNNCNVFVHGILS